MTEAELLAAFEACTFPRAMWRHRPHVTVAYLYLRDHGFEEALRKLRDGIRRYNENASDPLGYHETATVTWVRLIHFAMAAHGPSDCAQNFFDYHSYLLNKMLPLQYYSRARLMSLEAKERFVAPDLQPLPPLAVAPDAAGLTPDDIPVPIPPDPVKELARTTALLATDPDRTDALAHRAVAYGHLGMLERALEDCRRFAALDSLDPWGWLNISRLFERGGLHTEAAEAAARSRALFAAR